jgi:hypothetical protein
MIRKSIVAATAVLSLCSCASKSQHYTIYISPSFSSDEQEAIIKAAYEWEKAGASLTIYIGGGNCSSGNGIVGDKHTVCVLPSTRADIRSMFSDSNEFVLGRTEYNGFIDGGTSYLAMDQMSSLEKLQSVAAHEVGHGMSMSHLSPSKTDYPLMAADYDHPILELTDEDISAWEER